MRRCLLALITLSLIACSAPTDAPTPAPAPRAATDEAPAAVSAQAPSKLDKEEVHGLLEAWLAAQNEGDFEAYSGLYSSRFYGLKRSGPRTYRFARDGWVQDRQRMFRKPMVVKADQVEITTSSRAAEIRFIQSWSSGSYKDVGPKQLVVTREDGGLRLAREEMLSSKIIDATSAAAGPGDPGRFLFIEEMEGSLWVLLEEEADAEWGLGQPRLVSREPSIARKTADPGQLSTESTSMKGRVVVAYSDFGPVCKATIGELAVVSRFWPHFGMAQEWSGQFTGEVLGDHDVAEEIWGMGPKELWGRLGVVGRGDCSDARWARDASLPEARVWSPAMQVATSMQPTVESAFRKLAGYREIQQEFEKSVEHHADARWWDQYDGPGPVQVMAFSDPAAGRTLVAARATAGIGCGQFWGEFWAVWEVTAGGGGLTLLTDPRTPGEGLFLPTSVFDLEADGKPELLDEQTLVQPVDGTWQPTLRDRMQSYDCPC